MYPAFDKLPEDKKDLILTICIEEFSKNGYEKTSTDTITGRAGISKGILFHYFKSKKNLFLAVIEHCMKLLIEVTMEQVGKIETDDFFERIKAIILVKQKTTMAYFNETELLLRAITHPPVAVRGEIETMVSVYEQKFGNPLSLHSIYKGELLSSLPLREGVSAEKVFNFTMLVLTQISHKYMQMYKNGKDQSANSVRYEPIIEEIDAYIDLIKYGIYK